MRVSMTALGLCAALLCFVAPASAQDTTPGCSSASSTAAATPPAQGKDAGTSPGGMGSSGWSGGTGGSYIGTNPQGPTSGSNSPHPATATGLDPTKPSAPTNQKC